MHAVINGYERDVKILLKILDPDQINAVDNDGNTALILSVLNYGHGAGIY